MSTKTKKGESSIGVWILLIVVGVFLVGACLYAKNKGKSETLVPKLSSFENMVMSPHVDDIKYWPYYYYTLPYRYKEGGAWPPNMYTRMSHWQPGYDVHNWSFDMRPGVSFDRWRRNVWVKKNGPYYTIDNGTQEDRIYDYIDY